MKYCPTCDAPRSPEQQDDFGNCLVCGTPLLDDPAQTATRSLRAPGGEGGRPGDPATGEGTGAPPSPAETVAVPAADRSGPPGAAPAGEGTHPRPEDEAGTGSSAATARHRPTAQDPEAGGEPAPAAQDGPPDADEWVRQRQEREAAERPREARRDEAPPLGTGARAIRQPWRPPEGEPGAPPPPPAAATDYERIAAEVEANVREGYELFGLVGGPASGKTHALKALTYLLRNTGTQSDRASFELMQSTAPGPTGIKVGHYDFLGPSQRWTFVDAGGEIYDDLRSNEWKIEEHTARLSRWLHRCHGLFCFLHLRPGHFGGWVLDQDPTLEADPVLREQAEKGRRKALEHQAEVAFFRNFFLFLRALRAEDGDVGTVIRACRAAGSLEEALQDYHRSAPLLDVPVMFFFSQADTYGRDDFAVGPGTYVDPRRLEVPAAAFTARHLPTLFAGVASQVERFKFDFLQSYEEAETETLDSDGKPLVKTYWSPPDDPRFYLSAGLLAGLEFILRNPPRERRSWRPPQLTTRQALLLHRRLHPGDWEGVPRSLLGTWRRPAPRTPETAPEEAGATPPPPAPPGGET